MKHNRVSRCWRGRSDAIYPNGMKTTVKFRRLAAGLAAAVLAPLLAGAPAVAAAAETASNWTAAPEARARLVAGVSTTGVTPSAPFGLEIVLDDGWKTYWQAPGPQGYPPRLDWSGSDNVAGAEIIWPTPERFTILGYDSIGYKEAALLPMNVTFKDPTKPARIRLTVDYLTCAEICIPQFAELELDVPAGAPAPTEHAFGIDRARGQAPAPPGAGDAIERVWLSGPPDQPSLVAEASVSGGAAPGIDLFVNGLDGYFFRAPTIESLGGDRIRLMAVAIEVPPEPAAVGQAAAYTLRLGDARAIVQEAALVMPPAGFEAAKGASGAARPGPGLLLMLAIAFLGGLILNVMPCVLPVLAIKLMGALKHASGGRGAVRRGFLASAAGIVVSFGVLAAGAVALQSAGIAVGWGMQFQQPLFVGFMALVMAIFAANLWGLFEFGAPAVAGRASAALPQEKDGPWGDFWTGVLATALATPCSAPFVGAALSFALTQGSAEIFAIFLAMGVGLAAPYLATAAFPAIARFLPKPGGWMATLRKILSVAVALTGLWLLWVLWRQAGDVAAGIAVLAVLATVACLGLISGRKAWAGAAMAVVAGLVAVGLTATPPANARADNLAWVGFDEGEIARRVDAGETVLVDVTADWCVTCKWNKATVLSQEPVVGLLARADVIAMQADWTRPDPAISAYLARNGRYGIPFNIVYGPGAPDGLPLPELLSAGAVTSAISKAARNQN